MISNDFRFFIFEPDKKIRAEPSIDPIITNHIFELAQSKTNRKFLPFGISVKISKDFFCYHCQPPSTPLFMIFFFFCWFSHSSCSRLGHFRFFHGKERTVHFRYQANCQDGECWGRKRKQKVYNMLCPELPYFPWHFPCKIRIKKINLI